MNFKDARVVVTGGSIGIGKQLAVDLVARGAQVMVCARSASTLMNMATVGVLAVALPMAWLKMVVAALIVWWFTARDQV